MKPSSDCYAWTCQGYGERYARYEYVHFLYREYGSAVLMRPWRWSLIEPIEMIFLVFDMKESKMLINDNINDIMKENIV